MSELERIQKERERWEGCVNKGEPERFVTVSGLPVDIIYTPADLPGFDYLRDLGFPGEYPFTRGIRHNMYRGRLWTMRQFSGFGTARDTNARYKFLLAHGETGLSVAFDFPTLYGRDSDDPMARGEVGKCGVAVSSLEDMETLFDGIPLGEVSTSMTINGPAAVLWAFYIVTAEKQGVSSEKLRGTIQNDILKEYIAQKSWLFPPEPSMRIITDIMAFGARHVPKWNTISISGYHIREAGSTAAQELAFTLKDGMTYVEAGIRAGLDVDEFAPRLSFFFNSHLDFFEEIAKFRAARRIWAREMRETFKAKKPESWLLRFHTQTAGCTLTAQQPENNIVRTAFQALAAVLGGTQSLHTNSMDETWALPTEKAVLIALRTQQLIAEETGVINVIDPLGGSYYVEALTNRLEEQAYEYFAKIDALGGMIKAIEHGYPQREIAEAAYRYQKAVDEGRRTVVGVNKYVLEGERLEIPILKIDPRVEQEQCERLRRLRQRRDNAKVRRTLDDLKAACAGKDNVMYPILEAVRAYATLGEICGAMKEVFGTYAEPPMF
ncbi:MAG: methylmalonyl-CoA mutase family protein [candidate division WOR-3 bacterium]|uniref:Methylmalonyl-CoA mutase n=1 Tax=candidate division WOR-3 bacterium TaxID=2052148 RepID=A0A7C1NBH9_UNCW3|nr:methylmalonyl-CoA mutase family protein [candidate division WOR-3 bacterium]